MLVAADVKFSEVFVMMRQRVIIRDSEPPGPSRYSTRTVEIADLLCLWIGVYPGRGVYVHHFGSFRNMAPVKF